MTMAAIQYWPWHLPNPGMQTQSQHTLSSEKSTSASVCRSSMGQYGARGTDRKTTVERDTQVSKARRRRKGFAYWRLPLEIRRRILEFILPQRIVCIRSPEYMSRFPSTDLPVILSTFKEWETEMMTRACNFVFVLSSTRVHRQWWNRRDDPIYFPGIRLMDRWVRWEEKLPSGTAKLQGATVIANVLELVEDRYRGSRNSDIFAKHIQLGSFDGVKKFQLVLLTVECGDDLDIYGDDKRAVVDLDDKRLPDLLRRVFRYLRIVQIRPACVFRHRNGSNLLRHLRGEWNNDLRQLFEEQWLRNQTVAWSPEMFTDAHFGYHNRLMMVNRRHRTVERLVHKMPEIQPVIMFEKRWPNDYDMTMQFGTAQLSPSRHNREDRIWFGGKNRTDGLVSISNRRGMCISTQMDVGRVTLT
ncbi:hypothetical protein F4824DRAFT_53293 [Ustulina deusta]|nr:hypothetical protein F4824DRAFT_53293 [Ustulina deusta]